MAEKKKNEHKKTSKTMKRRKIGKRQKTSKLTNKRTDEERGKLPLVLPVNVDWQSDGVCG